MAEDLERGFPGTAHSNGSNNDGAALARATTPHDDRQLSTQNHADTSHTPSTFETQEPIDPSTGTHLLTGPPSLNYTLRTRKLSLFIFWSLILIDSIGIPIALYFGLWYGTSLSPNAVFSISTGCLGGVSIYEYVVRFWRLWKKNSPCRVLGARRWYLDWFHWNYSAAWFFIMVELIVGTCFTNPPIRLLAMPVASLLYWFGLQILLQDFCKWRGYKSPVRISSIPAGAPFRPGIYSIIEDVVAVDGSGGTRFRKRLNDRYEASHHFRVMLHRMTLFWGIGALAMAVLTTILIFTLQHDPAYVVGWTLPFVWAGIWVPATFWYVKRSLWFERADWQRKVREEGLMGIKKWETAEPRVRLRSVAEGANV